MCRSERLASLPIFTQETSSASLWRKRPRRLGGFWRGNSRALRTSDCVLLPNEFTDYAKSLIAATTSSANFYFWRHSGYFDSPTSTPLLHTWSLAVEEQFYILFPIFLVIVRRFSPQRLKLWVVVLLLA